MSGVSGPRLSTVPFKNLNSFNFDGVDDYFIGTSTYSELDGQNKMTFSAWIKAESLSSSSYLFAIGGSSTLFQVAVRLQSLSITNARCHFYIGNASNSERSYADLGAIKNDGQWHHIMICMDLVTFGNYDKVDFFLDGNLLTTNGYYNPTSLGNAGSPLNIANRENPNTGLMVGAIDEFAIWSGTDLRNDVATIYNNGEPTDLNNNGLTAPTTWQRMGKEAIWNGQTWIMVDVNGGYTNRSINMVEANRTTDVPPNPFTNTLSTTFDGVDDAIVIGTTSLGITSVISVSAWVKIPTTNTGGGGTNIQVIACEDTTSSGQRNWNMFWRGTGSNYFAFVIHHTNLSSSSVVSTGIIPNDGQWHNLVGTFDGTTNTNGLKLYIDGDLNVQGTAGSTGINSFTSSEPNIGRITGQNVWNFEGNIDEVAIFDTDQSSNVATIYNSGTPNDISNLSPLSWWRMGDGSIYPTINDEIGGNDGTMTNMTSANFVNDVPTFSKKSILLDGVDDYVTMGDISDIENINTLSIGFWFKYNSITTSADGLISKDDSTRVNGNWYIALQSNQVRFLLKTANGQDALNSTTLSSGTWYHTLCVWDGSNMKIYINGTLNNSISVTNATGTLGSTNDSVRIGRRINDRLDGFIDEVAIWTNDQSSNASAIGSTIPTDLNTYSPLHWWRNGDGDTSPTLTDNGSGGNDGTMTNFTTFSTDVPT